MSTSSMEQAVAARANGLFMTADCVADPWVQVCITGPDAAEFLHSQTTNDVKGLVDGGGHMNARVTRTGHLISLFSCHRVGPQQYVLVVRRSQQSVLFEAFDQMHFSEELVLTQLEKCAAVLQGPTSPKVLSSLGGAWAGVDWDKAEEGSIHRVEDKTVIRRSLTGDPGFLIWGDIANIVEQLTPEGGVSGEAANACLNSLRLEAGWPVIGPDTIQKRLLPETGLEQQTVSYTKGCYLGQEVIARIRTYGSLPKAMRLLIFDVQRKGVEHTLEQIPAPGEPVVLADGSKVGHFGSRALSPTVEKPVALAYLKKDVRTPGQEFTIWGNRGPMKATVKVAPLYTAADRQSRVESLYDRAIRVFAEGEEDQARALLNEALRIDPGFADGYEAIGVIFGRQGKFHEAIDFFRRLEEVAPLEPMVNTNLSLYYMKLGDKETAENQSALAAQKAMRRNREGTDIGAIAKEQSEARKADATRKKGMFEQVLEFDPEDPIALFGMGRSLSVLGQWDQAVIFLERASQVDRRNSAVYLAWGKALEALERPANAMSAYQSGIEVASRRGDLMPLKEMEHRILLIKATSG